MFGMGETTQKPRNNGRRSAAHQTTINQMSWHIGNWKTVTLDPWFTMLFDETVDPAGTATLTVARRQVGPTELLLEP